MATLRDVVCVCTSGFTTMPFARISRENTRRENNILKATRKGAARILQRILYSRLI